MAYIESHLALGRHPKTKKLARKLAVLLPQAVGHLNYLWWWAFDYAADGDLSRFEDADIADASLWEGDANLFVKALIDAGFVDADRRLHDWEQYGGKLLAKRKSDAKRKETDRIIREIEAMSDGIPTDIQRNSDGVPNTPEKAAPDIQRTAQVEEKRKEENRSSSARTRVRKVPRPLSEEEMARLVADFPFMETGEQIELAMSHDAHLKYPDNPYAYVRNWLRRWRADVEAKQTNGWHREPKPIEFVKPVGVALPDMGFRE